MSPLERINAIVAETTGEFRKGAPVTRTLKPGLSVTEVFAMPHADEAPKDADLVDMVFIKVAVHKERAAAAKAELARLVTEDDELRELLPNGPSYIHLGAALGSQGLALRFMALGHHLGLWKVMTAASIGITDEAKVKEMAGMGFLFATPLKEAPGAPPAG